MKKLFNNGAFWLISAIATFIGIITLIQRCNDKVFEEEGVYVIAKITGKVVGEKTKKAVGYYYFNHIYRQMAAPYDAVSVDERVYLKVLPSDPASFRYVENKSVQSCFYNDTSMQLSWKEMPQCTGF